MAAERTLSIIKPDATKRGLTDEILRAIEESGLSVKARKTLRLSRRRAEEFYGVHAAKPFFASLCEFMASAPISVQVLEGDDAVGRYRELMGATDPAQAEPATLRARFALSVEANSVHGSDSAANALAEINFFFPERIDED